MEPEPRTPNRTRENVVILTLTLFVGGILLFFLDLISFGIFTSALVVGSGVFLLGCFHYLAWGRALSDEVAEERGVAAGGAGPGGRTCRRNPGFVAAARDQTRPARELTRGERRGVSPTCATVTAFTSG